MNNQVKSVFKNAKVGGRSFNPLKNKKTGRELEDIDYMELLGRKCIEMDNQNRTNLPTDYGDYDIECVKFAKEIVKILDDGKATRKELNDLILKSIDFEL